MPTRRELWEQWRALEPGKREAILFRMTSDMWDVEKMIIRAGEADLPVAKSNFAQGYMAYEIAIALLKALAEE